MYFRKEALDRSRILDGSGIKENQASQNGSPRLLPAGNAANRDPISAKVFGVGGRGAEGEGGPF